MNYRLSNLPHAALAAAMVKARRGGCAMALRHGCAVAVPNRLNVACTCPALRQKESACYAIFGLQKLLLRCPRRVNSRRQKSWKESSIIFYRVGPGGSGEILESRPPKRASSGLPYFISHAKTDAVNRCHTKRFTECCGTPIAVEVSSTMRDS